MFSCLKRCFCRRGNKVEKIKGIYALELQDNKYYVGESSDVERRVWVHENGQGSAWTKKYEVLKQVELFDDENVDFTELKQTLLMMREYGIDNVRGSLFTSPFPLSHYEKVMAAQLYCELYDLCRKCGGGDHFITQCKNDTPKEWVNQFGGKLSQEKNRVCLECNKDISSLPCNFRYCCICFLKVNGYK